MEILREWKPAIRGREAEFRKVVGVTPIQLFYDFRALMRSATSR